MKAQSKSGNSQSPWRVPNFLDFEGRGLKLRDGLILHQYAIRRVRLRAKTENEKQELDFVERDCLRTLVELERGEIREGDPIVLQRMARMSRVIRHYESRIERINRRLWWLFFTFGLGVLAYAISQPFPTPWL